MMPMQNAMSEIGRKLVEHATEVEFSAKWGLVDELFPYIYKASKRMSTRAISRWLLEAQGVKLSAVTISTALQEPKKHWRKFFDNVEPAARIFAEAHELEMAELLEKRDLFEHFKDKPPLFVTNADGSPEEAFEEYQEAVCTLQAKWFVLDESIVSEGWGFLGIKPAKVQSKGGKKS